MRYWEDRERVRLSFPGLQHLQDTKEHLPVDRSRSSSRLVKCQIAFIYLVRIP